MLTEQQLVERKSGIGGSDIGAILGLNKWTSPLDVYLDKTGQADGPDLSDNEAVHFGNVLEDTIAQEYARRTGCKVRRRNQRFTHPDHEWMAANIDRSVDGERMILECKNSSQWMAGSWGESGTDEVPESYLVQVAWYMAILGYDRANLAALIGGNNLRIYEFDRDLELESLLIDRSREFWFHNVLAGVAPAPSCKRDLDTLYAMDNGEAMLADQTTEARVRELSDLRAKIKEWEKQADTLKFDIQAAMGSSATLLLGEDGSPLATWKSPKPGRRLQGKRLKEERPDIWERYAPVAENSRRFLVKI